MQCRFIGNRSSGRQGAAIALELARRGMMVDFISGPSHIPTDHPGIQRVDVETALEMKAAAEAALNNALPDAIIGAAAVADVRPASPIYWKAEQRRTSPKPYPWFPTPTFLAGINAVASPACFQSGICTGSRKWPRRSIAQVEVQKLRHDCAEFHHRQRSRLRTHDKPCRLRSWSR